MQKAMQADAAVFRTGETLKQGVDKLQSIHARMADLKVTDRTLVWNSDLVETLELDNLVGQAAVTVNGALNRAGKPRRPRPGGLHRPRRRQLDEAHSGLVRHAHRQDAISTTGRCTPSP